ncbi:MAG: hypothetical protein LAT63_17025 [Marinobacter sp.]|nr:hypothetical protein [Marinobacter sp.]
MPELKVSETELEEVLAWAKQHALAGHTEHEEGTYEEGVFDGIRWALGMINVRPDSP